MCFQHIPPPRGEGGPLPALSPSGAGRVRGYSGGLAGWHRVILIVASIATPIYMTCAVRAREAIFRADLF